MKSERDKKQRTATLILAAGKGTRMKSELAKVLHPVLEKPMLDYVIALAGEIGAEKIGVIIGHQAELIQEKYKGRGLTFVLQRQQLGTGHAVLQAGGEFSHFRGTVIILCGDVPLLQASTVVGMLAHHHRTGSVITVLTTLLEDPASYGRVVKDTDGRVLRIVEARDATEEEKSIREINTGIYCVESPYLFDAVAQIGNQNVQKEYYLTDICEIANRGGLKVSAFVADNPLEVMGINTVEDLQQAHEMMARRQNGR